MTHDALGHGHPAPVPVPVEMAHEEHPSNPVYVRVAIILSIITFVEVVIYYVPTVRPLLVPALIVLSLAKFLMVIGFFMHLKFDNPLFRLMFAAGLILSLSVYIAMLAMFWTDPFWAPLLNL